MDRFALIGQLAQKQRDTLVKYRELMDGKRQLYDLLAGARDDLLAAVEPTRRPDGGLPDPVNRGHDAVIDIFGALDNHALEAEANTLARLLSVIIARVADPDRPR